MVAGCALAACGTETGGSGDGAKTSLTGVRWVPQSVTVDGKKYQAPTDRDPYVTFDPGVKDGAGGDSGGRVGCNDIGADVTVEGGTIRVSDVMSTLRRCIADLARFETHFLEVFEGELTYDISDGGETLVLTGEDGDRITLAAGAAADAE